MTLPLSDEPINAQFYQDLNTGCVYELSPTTGAYALVYCPPDVSSGGVLVGDYRWNTTRGVPASGRARFDVNPTAGFPNVLNVNKIELGGDDRTPYLSMIEQGDTLWVDDHAGTIFKAVVTDPPIDSGTYFSFNFVPEGVGEPADNAPISIAFVEAAVGGGGGGPPDIIPPATPTGLVLTSAITPGPGGGTLVELRATLVQPGDADLFGSYVAITAENDNDPVNPAPIWTNAAVVLIGKGTTVGVLKGVAGATRYWARAYARDLVGNQSGYTANADHITLKDETAPTVPSALTATPGFKAVGLTWSASSAADLMFNEVRYAPEVTPGVPDTAASTWSPPPIRARTNSIVITGLDPALTYLFQVRAVDQSGNVATSDVIPTAVDYLANPENGWSPLVSATPLLVGAEDMAFDTVVTNFLTSGEISAGMITSGTLIVDPTGDYADGIEVWLNRGALNAVRIGLWDETGLYIGKNVGGLPDDLTSSDYIHITDAGLTTYLQGVPQSAITPAGINATAINFGSLPGGMNLVKNSSFELAPFPTTVPAGKDWNVAADWSGSQQTNTNATNGAGAVNVTGTSY